MKYEALTFNIPELTGISKESIDLHLGLYQGYVKHVNLIAEKIAAYSHELEANTFAITEMQRRLGFEFGGMRNHEYYFAQFENGAKPLSDSPLQDKIIAQFDSVEAWQNRFIQIAMTRGVGWAMLYHDPHTDALVQTWVDEQHIGQLADVDIVLALDMWEHSYMRDYVPADKKKYIEAFFANLNWDVIAGRLV